MKYLLCFAAAVWLFYPMSAKAETFSARNGDNRLTLSSEPCEIGPWFKQWKKATWYYQGQVFEACWKVMGNAVMTIDSAGDLGAMPMQAFKKDEAI